MSRLQAFLPMPLMFLLSMLPFLRLHLLLLFFLLLYLTFLKFPFPLLLIVVLLTVLSLQILFPPLLNLCSTSQFLSSLIYSMDRPPD
jgi:hypothetical protein